MGTSHNETKTVQATNHNDVVTTDVWGEFDAIVEAEKIRPDEITVRMYMDKYGNSYPQAYRVLQKMEKAGKLKSRVIVLDGNQTRVYSKMEA